MTADDDKGLTWSGEVVARVAGCEQKTLNSWIRRYELLGGPESITRAGKSFKFDFLQVCVARATAMMVEHGIWAPDACSPHIFLAIQFERILTHEDGEPPSRFFVFGTDDETKTAHFEFADESTLAAAIVEKSGGLATVIDLQAVVDFCARALKVKIEVRDAR